MKTVALILAAAMTLLLSACVVGGKQPAKVAAAPPPPKPAALPAPAPPPPPPLSIPQTTAELPTPQPISAEALATTRLPEEPAENQPSPRVPRRQGPVAGPPRPEPPPAQPQTTAAPAPEPERPPLQEILPAAEAKRLQDSVTGRRREIHRVLDPLDPKKLNDAQRALVTRIKSFLQLSDEAESRNDMRQADALAERAQALLRELQGGR